MMAATTCSSTSAPLNALASARCAKARRSATKSLPSAVRASRLPIIFARPVKPISPITCRCIYQGRAKIIGRRLARTAIGNDFVADLLAFAQRAEASAFNGADVDEHVIATINRLNEAVALGRVKPLHCSHAHVGSSSQVDVK